MHTFERLHNNLHFHIISKNQNCVLRLHKRCKALFSTTFRRDGKETELDSSASCYTRVWVGGWLQLEQLSALFLFPQITLYFIVLGVIIQASGTEGFVALFKV